MAPHTRRFGVDWSGPVLLAGLAALTSGQPLGAILAQPSKAPVVNSLRMYVFDLGNIPVDQGDIFDPPIQVATGGCCIIVGHLIVHPKGTLIWDTGVVPDELIGSGQPGTKGCVGRPFKAKLADIGYRPEDITYLALSHYHFDHTANAKCSRTRRGMILCPSAP